jgi:hypothetical protein
LQLLGVINDYDIEYPMAERANPEEFALELERIGKLISKIETQVATLLNAAERLPDGQGKPIIEKAEAFQEAVDELQDDLTSVER